jgi:hypothetical protein
MSSAERGRKIPGQQFRYSIDGVLSNSFQDLTEVSFRIESVELDRTEQRIDRGSAFATSIRSGEKIVLPAQSHCTEGSFGRGIINLDTSVLEVAAERTPTRKSIANRPCSVELARKPCKAYVEPAMESSITGRARV